jgi:GT2 family glycosyltransferase
MTTPIVSVVMSVFNAECFLREAVESILAQSFRELELIIIDDGSTDCSGSILDYYQRRDSRVYIHHQENKGLIDSLNLGCALARGKYIARMDADDIAIRDRLFWQVDLMERLEDVGLLGGAVQLIDVAGRPLSISQNPIHDCEIRAALADCPFWHPTILMRKQAFQDVGGYRKLFVDAEDHDLWVRIADRYRLANLRQVLVKYRIHPDQVSVRKCRQQTLTMLAIRAALRARNEGKPDPLESVEEITPAVLTTLGVSETTQQASLARKYLWRIRSMADGNLQALAPGLLAQLLYSFDWRGAEPRVIADLRLLEARLCWHERRFVNSILAAGRAIMIRPMVLARPLKPLLCAVGFSWLRKAREHSFPSVNDVTRGPLPLNNVHRPQGPLA